MNWMPEAIRDGILVVLIISGPLVLTAATIGLAVGILQAATQVQEQTIGTAVKILGVFGLMIIAGFWMFQYLNQYMSKTITTAFTIVPRRSQKVLRSDAYDSMGGNDFSERINSNAVPLKVIEPERIESEIPTGGAPGSGYLGAPKIPEAPAQGEFLPPQAPKIPQEPLKQILPQGFQELKPMPLDFNQSMGSLNKKEEEQNQIKNESVDMQQINYVPGTPKKKIDVKKEDLVLRKPYDLNKLQEDSEEEFATWLN